MEDADAGNAVCKHAFSSRIVRTPNAGWKPALRQKMQARCLRYDRRMHDGAGKMPALRLHGRREAAAQRVFGDHSRERGFWKYSRPPAFVPPLIPLADEALSDTSA